KLEDAVDYLVRRQDRKDALLLTTLAQAEHDPDFNRQYPGDAEALRKKYFQTGTLAPPATASREVQAGETKATVALANGRRTQTENELTLALQTRPDAVVAIRTFEV